MADPIEIPASEVREQISDILSRVAFGGERVIISRNGKPQVALIPIADLKRLEKLQAYMRQSAGEALERIRAQAAEAGLDKLTDEEIDQIIDEARRERREKEQVAR
ncbi:MAG TPA: type II toxin-antitoxin system Phd/YefM family antitoxin [Myxococcaceae bacterium]|nr:type II toxin-antitoxin system Phd/YefM family antitoxin [Myxococcaceae bacterium]